MLTIVIPTRNRPKLIQTQLKYWAAANPKQKLLIVDASDEPFANEGNAAVQNMVNHLPVQYERAIPVNSPWVSYRTFTQTREALYRVDTPYVAVSGDDDFFVPNGLTKIINMLESSHDAILGVGRSIGVLSTGIGESAKVEFELTPFPQQELIDGNPFRRVIRQLAHFRGSYFGVMPRMALENALNLLAEYE